ncbi:MAG: Type 1 glutamine amidotransferase-like domain-containing protein [Clostridia bacterium]|nr:Type 1 glutamine amidotransferase-like domain-containing protein [Clostridia bacterium]
MNGMHARLIGMFSGFPTRRFPSEIAARLDAALPERRRIVFISAWPDDAARNDEDAAGMHGMFAECGMAFERFAVIDERTTTRAGQQMIGEADCVFLMGGNPTAQMQFIRRRNLAEALRRFDGVLLGVSAGSINMARRALDVWESPEPYEGLGLTGITIKSHVNPGEQALLEKLQEISSAEKLPICAMEDESAIFLTREGADWLGNIRYVEDGVVTPLTQKTLTILSRA